MGFFFWAETGQPACCDDISRFKTIHQKHLRALELGVRQRLISQRKKNVNVLVNEVNTKKTKRWPQFMYLQWTKLNLKKKSNLAKS